MRFGCFLFLEEGVKRYFSLFEVVLWGISVLLVTLAFVRFGGNGWLSYMASLIGVTSLVLSAKGNPAGQALMIVFSLLYGILSWSFSYYGEMMTYLGMTLPMAVLSLIQWVRHPFRGKRDQVAAESLKAKEVAFMLFLSAVVTTGFFFLLRALGNACLPLSTLSVATSFAAAYLTFRRSPYFALAYALNDLVLILLWAAASAEQSRYMSVTVCFCVFFVNDLYGFYRWLKRRKKQSEEEKEGKEM
ncbi:MAG: nicotinamide mononucleotide transporter [Clostridia bacterium]|nr:nicotinamide mononucleotide transporter [Clostridia bacterium]